MTSVLLWHLKWRHWNRSCRLCLTALKVRHGLKHPNQLVKRANVVGIVAIATVIGNWHNVLRAINMASSKFGSESDRPCVYALTDNIRYS